jgi:hypothetical protein
LPTSNTAQMFGCWSAAIAFDSLANRARRLASEPGRILMATMRSSRVSRAL